VLAEEPERDERRRSRRELVTTPAALRAHELTLYGVLHDLSTGGAFLRTNMLIEIGERGLLIVGEIEAAVQVVWLRGNAHVEGPGMALAFEDLDAAARICARFGVE
jgi:hypothetical protein